MAESERIVAVVSPWDKLSDLIKRKFRVESLPAQKMVMVWREDIQTKQEMEKELKRVGITSFEVRKQRVTAKW